MPAASPANRRLAWYCDPRWLMAGLVLFAVTTTLYGLFGPDTPIVVAPETTVITTPLADDGLPDYAAHVLARFGRGTPQEDNAAVPLLMALWPAGIDADDLPTICRELGVAVPDPAPEPFRADAFARDAAIRAAIEQALTDRRGDGSPPVTTNDVLDVLDAAENHPWSAAALPALDAWLATHAARLDLIVTASRRPRLYLPCPKLLRGQRGSVLEFLIAPTMRSPWRAATKCLSLRAMRHLGGGRAAAAWDDIVALHRFARMAADPDGGSLVGQLMAVALSARGCQATLQLLDAPSLSADVLTTIRHDLAALPLPDHVEILTLDRIASADLFVHLYGRPRSERRTLIEQLSGPMDDVLARASLDGNVILEDMHAAYAALDQALRLPAWQDRERELSRLEAARQAPAPPIGRAAKLVDACQLLLNRGSRSARIGQGIIAEAMSPAMASVDATLTRHEAVFDLTRVAVALAAFRATDGDAAYPARLDELVPRFLDRLPKDPFTGNPFVYERRGAGYLLYSLGPNGRDDGGTDFNKPIVAGEWAAASPHLGDAKTTDLVVRLPLPGSPILELLRSPVRP